MKSKTMVKGRAKRSRSVLNQCDLIVDVVFKLWVVASEKFCCIRTPWRPRKAMDEMVLIVWKLARTEFKGLKFSNSKIEILQFNMDAIIGWTEFLAQSMSFIWEISKGEIDQIILPCVNSFFFLSFLFFFR